MRCAAATLAAALTVICAGCGSGPERDANVAAEPPAPSRAAEQTVAVGGWRVSVSFEPPRLGPIVFGVEKLRRGRTRDFRPWIEHRLVFRNAADQPVTFADTRRAAFVGEAPGRRLLAADQGCGYGRTRAGAPAWPICLLYADVPTLEPGASMRRRVSLFRGLPGMDQLAAGTYVFRRRVTFRPRPRGSGTAQRVVGVVRLVYQVERRSE